AARAPGGAIDAPRERPPSGIVEGAQHAGHIVQGRTLETALAEWAPGLVLEVDDREVVPAAQDLLEVVIAVTTDPACRDLAIEQPAEARQGAVLVLEDPPSLPADR